MHLRWRQTAVTHRRMRVLATAITLIGVVAPIPAVPEVPEIVAAVPFTEGPSVDRDGNVYFTEMVSQRIMKLSANGVLSTFREQSNSANGLLVDPQGRLVACEGADSQQTGVLVKYKPQITANDLLTGEREVLADSFHGQPFVGPNDVTIDGKGRLYFTDLPGGAVYRIDRPGQVARILAVPDIQRPNGIQISPDDKQLYLVDRNGERSDIAPRASVA